MVGGGMNRNRKRRLHLNHERRVKEKEINV